MTSHEPVFPTLSDEAGPKPPQDAGRRWTWARSAALAIVLIYAVAFWLPVFDNSNARFDHMSPGPRGVVPGYQAFLLGWMYPGWFANIALWAGLVLLSLGRARGAAVSGVVAVLLGLSYLGLLSEVAQDPLIHERRYLSGYFAWLASMGLLAGAGIGLWRARAASRAIGAATIGAAVAVIAAATGQAVFVRVYHRPTAEQLRAGLNSASPKERLRAAQDLSIRPDAGSIPELRRALADPDDEVRSNAIQALSRLGGPAREVIPELIAILRGPTTGTLRVDPRIAPDQMATSRDAAAMALGQLGPEGKAGIPALIAALSDSNQILRRWAAYSLGKLGAPASPEILAILKDPDVQLRRNAIQILQGARGAPEVVVPALIEAMGDPDSGIRYEALTLLGGYAGEAPELVLPPLAAAAINPAEPDLQATAVLALGKVGTAAAPALVAALRGTYGPAPDLASSALEKIGTPAVAPLLQALPGADAELRRRIFQLFYYLGPKAAEAAPILEAALEDDPDPRARDLAYSAFFRIDPSKGREIFLRRSSRPSPATPK